MPMRYQCQKCGASDSDRSPLPARALFCWRCWAGRGISIEEQIAKNIGMLPVLENERFGAEIASTTDGGVVEPPDADWQPVAQRTETHQESAAPRPVDDVIAEYGIAAGHFLVVRDEPRDSSYKFKTDERQVSDRSFEPWATVLMVGERYHDSDYCPPVVKGQRVFISAIGGRQVKLGSGSDEMEVTLIPHTGVLFWQILAVVEETLSMVDDGEKVEKVDA